MTTAARFQAAAAVVRRLNAAVKSRRLYAHGHLLRAQTISALLAALAAYHERFGSFVLETHRHGLIVEGKPFEGGESVDNLALQLYAMGIWQLIVVPGLSEEETAQLLEVVSLDREEILAAGGFVPLLAARGVAHVRVVELKPGEEDVAQITPEIFQQLLDGSLSAPDRAMLVGLLRSGPETAARLVGVVVERARQAFPDAKGDELAGRIYQALTALDRLIVDSPPGESQELLKTLAAAVADLDDPTDGAVPKAILAAAGHDLSARALVSAMTSEQIARMVIPCLEAGDPPPQAGQLVQALPFDPDKARETLALISQRTGRSFDVPALLEELAIPRWIHNFPQDLMDFQITSEEVAVTDEEIRALVEEARTDDATLIREQTLLLLHVAVAEEDLQEREGALEVLVRLAVQHLQAGDLELVSAVLRGLQELLAGPGPRGDAGRYALRVFLTALPGLLAVRDVWAWTDEHPLLHGLKAVGRPAAATLIQSLPQERDAARRQVVTALLAKLGDDAVDLMVPSLSDANPEHVRPVIQALAQTRTAKAVRALRAVANHPDVKVRRDAIDALRTTQLTQAQDTLLAFLHDPDEQVRQHCVGQLTPETARRIAKDLVAMLESRDLARAYQVRIVICETLVRARAVDMIPALRRLGSPFKLRSGDREVARHVRAAVATLGRAGAERGPAQRRAS